MGAWAQTYPQQSITSFSPGSGSAGTVITVTGSGFTGSDAAWLGSAHDAGIVVVSDSEVQVTVPPDAVAGGQSLGILNPSHTVFPPNQFTVTVPGAWVYYNGGSSWADNSYAGAANYSDTSGAPLSGKFDISMSAQQWGVWQMSAPNGVFSLANYSAVTFALKPTVANQDWSVEVETAGGKPTGLNLNVLAYGAAPVVGKWAIYTVPLAALGVAGGSISKLAIQDQTGLASNTWYVDNVGFLADVSGPPVPAVTLVANPTTIQPGGKSTLTWGSTNAASCSGNNGLVLTAPAGSLTESPAGTTTYTVTCTGPGGSGSASATVTVMNGGVAPTVSLTANVTALMTGGLSTLTWSSANATSCTSSGWSASQATSGTQQVTPTTTTSYTLSCTGAGGSAHATTTVTVNPSVYWVYEGGTFYWPGDYSFAATPNYRDSSGGPISGPYDIEVQLIGTTGFGGWLPYAWNWAFDSTPYTYLTFALKPTVANQTWSCRFVKVGDIPEGSDLPVTNYGPAPVVGRWGIYTVPLADLAALGTSVYKFAIQDQTGLKSNTWYVDNVGFLTTSGRASAAPTVTFKANPAKVTAGSSATLSWSATNATGCNLSGVTGVQPTSDALTVIPAATTTYTLVCTGAGGTGSASQQVTVNPD